jgi:hypothetical protein
VATWYTALWTATGEVTGTGYSRKSTDSGFVLGKSGNVNVLTWGPLTATWGTVVGIKIFTVQTGGDPIYVANTTQSVVTQVGYRYRISKGEIQFPSGGTFDTSLFDETLWDQPEIGTMLPPVELKELTIPPPAPARFRVLDWARRPM